MSTKRKPDLNNISNPDLVQAIDQLNLESDDDANMRFFHALYCSTLILPIYGTAELGEPQDESGWSSLAEGTSFTMIMLTSPEGESAFPVFSDRDAVLLFEPDGLNCLAAEAADVFAMFLSGDAELLVVNPGSEYSAEVKRVEVEKLFERLSKAGLISESISVTTAEEEKRPMPKVQRRYRLPRIVEDAFHRLVEVVPAEVMIELGDRLETSFVGGSDSAEYYNEDEELRRELHRCSRYLLELYPEVPPEKRGLIVGAIRHFVRDELDFEPEEVQLDDTVRVMNHVLEELGVEHMFIMTD